MTLRIRDWSLHTKLGALLMGVTSLALVLLLGGILVREMEQLTANLGGQVRTVGNLLEPTIAFALSLDNAGEIGEKLAVVDRTESRLRAAVYDAEGRCVAQAPTADWAPPRRPAVVDLVEIDGWMRHHRTVPFEALDGGKRHGSLLLEASFDGVSSTFLTTVAQSVAALLLLLGALAAMSRRLVGTISAPLLALADVARRVRATQDYGLRARQHGHDEVGDLVGAFNAMLGEIQSRDAAMADNAGRLEREVQRRTEELERTAQNLRIAKERAEASVEARSQFLANVSHEIRTPLNAILGMTDLALGTALDAEQREYIGTVKQSGDALLSIIEEILDFAKIDAGKVELAAADVDLRALINDTLRPLAVRAEAKGIDLVADVAPEVPARVSLDPLRLQQVLTNLVGNAVKFTDAGEVVLGVEVRGDRLEFAVRDSGIGIPAKSLERIFEPFAQADGTTSRRFGGTGLGLTISRQLVGLWGGSLDVVSTVGHGSRFSFDVPMVVVDTAAPVPPLRPLSVLLAIDLPAHAAAMARVLRHWGCNVVVSTAKEAAALLASVQQPFDLVIGRGLAGSWGRAGVAHHNGRASVLLLVSPARLAEGMARIEAEELAGYVMWPFAEAELRRKIDLLLGAAPAAVGEPTAVPAGQPKLLRILVAEDNPINQRLIAAILDKAGHAFELAGDGAACVEAYRRGVFDLVLMDMQMPVMDGVEAAHHIRDFEAQLGRRIPILALTANATAEDRLRCEQAGMDGFLTKPIRPAKLLAALESRVGGTPSR